MKQEIPIKISLDSSAKTIETEVVNKTKKLHTAAFRVSGQKGDIVSLPEPSNSKPASQMSIGELSAMGKAFSAIKKCVG